MKHFIEIDDKTKTGKNLVPLLKELSKTNIGIGVISEEEVEDRLLSVLIREGLKSGIAPRKRVLGKLGLQ